jgi:hypothetical protein
MSPEEHKRTRITNWNSLYVSENGSKTALIGQGQGQGKELCKMSIVSAESKQARL